MNLPQPEDRERLLPTKAYAWILAILLIAGAVLRFLHLGSGLWYDEIVTLVESVRLPFATLVTSFPGNNNHLLYSILGHFAITVCGESAWSVRLPAALFGIAALPLTYLFGKQVTNRFEALVATALLAFSYHHIWFSQNARGYTMLLFFHLLATHLLVVGLKSGKRGPFALFAVVAALGAYTHLTMVFSVVGQALVAIGYLLARDHWRPQWRTWITPALGFVGSGVLTLLFYAPLLTDVQQFFGEERPGAQVTTVGWALLEMIRGLQLGYATLGAVLVGGTLGLVGCWSYLRQRPSTLAFFIVPGLVLFAVTVILQRPTFPRFFFFLAPMALLIGTRGTFVTLDWVLERLQGVSWVRAGGRWWPLLAAGTMVAVSLAMLPKLYKYPKQDYAGALAYLEENVADGDIVMVAGAGAKFPYQEYYGKRWERLGSAEELVALREGGQTVWVVYTLKMYIIALEPALWDEVQTNFEQVKAFPGTIPGGSIYITRHEPK